MSTKMFCTNCGTEIGEDDAFCLECGQKVEREGDEAFSKPDENDGAEAQADAAVAGAAAGTGDAAAADVSDAPAVASADDAAEQPADAQDSAAATAPMPDAPNAAPEPAAAPADAFAPASAPASEPAPATASAAASATGGGFKAWLSVPKNKKIAIGVVAVVVVAIVGFNVFNYFGSQVSASALEQSMKESYDSGFISTAFTNGSEYKYSDTRLNKNEKIESSSPAYSQLPSSVKSGIKSANQDIYYVEWYGKATNDSFESEYTAQGYFTKEGFGFKHLVTSCATWHSTKPTKGVEVFYLDSGKVASKAGYCVSNSVDNFTCDFDAEKQTCSAKETYGVKYWWGEDSVDVSQKFKFDAEKGWVIDGEAKTENFTTKYTELEGMSFSASNLRSYFFSSSGSLEETASMTFKTCSADSVVADYTMAHHPGGSGTENTIDLSGQASGTLKHSLSQTGFEFDLNGSSDGVRLKGYSWYDEDNLHTLTVSMESSAPVSKSIWSSNWSFTRQTFIQSSDSSVSGSNTGSGSNQNSSSGNDATNTAGNATNTAGTNSYVLKDSASKTLGDSDISGLSDDQICIAQNEIWARHGRKFENKWLQDYFNGQSWYSGTIEAADFLNKYAPTQTETDNANFLSNKLVEHGYDLNKAHPN